MKSKKVIWLFFIALTLFYLSLSPGSISGMGYMRENLNATSQIVSNILDWLSLEPAAMQIDWPRHGFLELIFEVPFVLFSRLLFGSSQEWADRILAIQPVLATSLLCTIIFKWVHKITSSLIWSYAIALAAGLGTMLWPYAYIGLETTQSLFLLLSAYLALESERSKNWLNTALFALSCAVAVSVKSTGVVLVPAVGFLIFIYFRRGSAGIIKTVRSEWRKLLLTGSIIAIVLWLSVYTRSLFWTKFGSGSQASFFFSLMVDSPLMYLMNLFSFFGSINKGLLIYCPIIVLALLRLRWSYRENPYIVIFALLSLAGLIGTFSLLVGWSDEVWGPRLAHSSVAPLIICLALTRKAIAFRVRREAPLLMLAGLGLAISFLGCFFFYGALHIATMQASQSTIEGLQSDITYNHIRFNSALFQVWMRETLKGHDPEPQPWPPPHHWWFPQPSDAQWKTINLEDFANPQPTVIHAFYGRGASSESMLLFLGYFLSLVFGFALLIWTGRLAVRSEALPDQLGLPGMVPS